MKVAIIAQPFDVVPPLHSGSLAIWADELARRLARRHEVAIYSCAAKDLPNHENRGGVAHFRTQTDRDNRWIHRLRWFERIARKMTRNETYLFYRYYYFNSYFYQNYISDVSKKIEQHGADVIVVVNFSQFVDTLNIRNPDKKIILVMQCDWLIELDEKVVRRRLEKIDAVCGCSAYITNGVAQRFPQYAEKCHTIYNGCNPELFKSSTDQTEVEKLREHLNLRGRKVLTFIGRLTPEKGVHVLIEAMRLVTREVPEAVLLVIGGYAANPPSPLWLRKRGQDKQLQSFEELKQGYEQYLKLLAAEVNDTVRLLGRVSYYDLPLYYTLSDVFVHPAIWNEPFGMITTEAMACEKPVVSTKVGGVPEIIIDEETGLLAEPGDPQSLADSIIELLGDDPRRARMGRKGKERVLDCFTWDNTAEKFDEVLVELQEEGLVG